jgi:hypothetical protein
MAVMKVHAVAHATYFCGYTRVAHDEDDEVALVENV